MSWLGVAGESPPRPWSWPWRALAGVLATATGMACCGSLLFFAMRGLMELGGFAAHGGPYQISEQAPGWVWVLPSVVVVGMILGFANARLAIRAGGFGLALPAWSLLLLALGWNFAEYGIAPTGGGGPVWAWVACAVAFAILGLAPLLLCCGVEWPLVERVREQLELRAQQRALTCRGVPDGVPSLAYRRAYLVLTVIAVVVGGLLGALAFRAIAG